MVEPETYCTKTKLEKQITYKAQEQRRYLVPELTEALNALQLWTRGSLNATAIAARAAAAAAAALCAEQMSWSWWVRVT
eukprot:6468852-Amphidinium_carterae.1